MDNHCLAHETAEAVFLGWKLFHECVDMHQFPREAHGGTGGPEFEPWPRTGADLPIPSDPVLLMYYCNCKI